MELEVEVDVLPEAASKSGRRLRDWANSASLRDLLNASPHSADFDGLRAEYLFLRVRLLSLIFAVLAPLWIPIDYLFLKNDLFVSLLSMRLAFSGLYLALGMWRTSETSLVLARWRVLFFLLIPSLFYVGSRLLMSQYHSDQEILVGYMFLPFLLVGLLAVFPLTFVEGTGAALFVGAFLLAAELIAGTLLTITTLANFWLLGLLATIALWAELTQLHMLLRLYREATRDPLTRLVNRRVINRWLALETVGARREGTPLTVLLFDLDLFKRINDTYGHLSGDAVLRAFGEILQREASTPLIGRYGGEEFLAILPGVDARSARLVAERIRNACHDTRIQATDGSIIRFTTSVGVAEMASGDTAESLIHRVDKGLYQAKEAGRDLVTVAE